MSVASFGPQDTAYEFLTELVHKRIATINYLRRAHEGNTHWFNTVLLSKEDLAGMYQNPKMRKRSLNFYTLGTSLAPILDVSNPPDYVKALNLLLQEFEYHTNDHSKPKMKNIFRKARSKDDHAYMETGEYTHLIITNVPFEIDYIQTFFTLCDILCEVYHKMLINTNGGVCTQSFCETVLKIDGRFKKIVSLITKELDALARNAIREELETVDPLSSMKTGSLNFEEWES